MKEMSYRDKMVILVISIIIILVAGFFALIKPKYNAYVADQAQYEITKTEWDGIKQKLDAIPGLKDQITATYKTAKNDASMFVNTAFGDANDTLTTDHINYVIDQYIQPAIDESNLQVTEFSIGGAGSVSVGYRCYTPNVVTYALLEAADINGNYAEKIEDIMYNKTVIEEKQNVEMLGQNIALNVTGTKEQLMTFLEAIKADENAILIDSVDISDYKFKGGLEDGEVISTDAEGNEVRTVVHADPNAEGTSDINLSITFYNAKEIDVPDLGD